MQVHSGMMFSSSLSKLMLQGAVALVRDVADGLGARSAAGAFGCEVAELVLAMLKWQSVKAESRLMRR